MTTLGKLRIVFVGRTVNPEELCADPRRSLISGFPPTRRSWNRLIPLLSQSFQTVAADLPSFGNSGILAAPATTENVARVFHDFVANLGTPLHVIAHDFGAWVACSWARLFESDFKSLTLIDAGIPASYGRDRPTKQLVAREELNRHYQNFSAAGLAVSPD